MRIKQFKSELDQFSMSERHTLSVVVDGDTYSASISVPYYETRNMRGNHVPREYIIRDLTRSIANEITRKLEEILA